MVTNSNKLVPALVASAILFAQVLAPHLAAQNPQTAAISENKQTVQKYMEGFTKSDHAAILACLTDDVEWFIPGAFRVVGKAAFNKEIENDAFVGSPTIKVTRMTEEHNVVVAEGSVR